MGENMLLYHSVLDCQQNMIKHRQWTSCLHACIYSILAALETLSCSHLTCVLCILSMCLILVSGIMRYHFHFDFLSQPPPIHSTTKSDYCQLSLCILAFPIITDWQS